MISRLISAIRALPCGVPEDQFVRDLTRIAREELGCASAQVVEGTHGHPLTPDLSLATDPGDTPPGAVEALAAAAGRVLLEIRTRTRLARRVEALTRRVRDAEERHRSLTLRLEELKGELDTSQYRHAVLNERNRIAQDLHDRAAQTNFLLALKLDWLQSRLEPDSPLRDEVERLKELASEAAAQTREAIYALRAPELAEGGLLGGLRRLVRTMEQDGLKAELSVSGPPTSFPPEVEDALFKVAQEALNNARKHSRGSAVMMALRCQPDAVTLVVQDNGIGIDRRDEAPPPGRFGLRGMRERVEALGGDLALISGDEGGLIVRARIPLKR